MLSESSRTRPAESVPSMRGMLSNCGHVETRMAITAVATGFIFIVACTALADTAGATPGSRVHSATPGEECRIGADQLPQNWTDPERWTWKEICAGRDADFSRRLSGTLDPRDPSIEQRWSDPRRTLGPAFLKTILQREPFRSAVPDRGVHIAAAYFPENVDLSDAVIQGPLVLTRSLFQAPVSMARLATPAIIAIVGSRFADRLNMDSASIGGNLIIRNSQFAEVRLAGASIHGQFSMSGTTFDRELNLASISIGGDLLMTDARFAAARLTGAAIGGQLSLDGSDFSDTLLMDAVSTERSLFMRNAGFAEVSLIGAKIGGQLAMHGSKFRGPLVMDAVSTVRSLSMVDNAEFADVRLFNAVIGGQLAMDGSTFRGRLDMDTISVGGDLLMRRARFLEVHAVGGMIDGQLSMDGSRFERELNMESISTTRDLFMRHALFDGPASLIYADIGSNLDARGAKLGMLDLTGARIERELRLGLPGQNIEWRDYRDRSNAVRPPTLTLLNTRAGALQDTEETWPANLERELQGFTYASLGGSGASGDQMPGARTAEWFINWLARNSTFSPQTYRQLALALRQDGYESKANEILFALQDRRRNLNTTPFFTRVLLTISWIFLGYGYEVWRTLVGFLVLIAFGFLVTSIPRDSRRVRVWRRLFYSLESAVPLIGQTAQNLECSKELAPWVDRYFQIHKIIGLLLVSLLIAGLTGLVT